MRGPEMTGHEWAGLAIVVAAMGMLAWIDPTDATAAVGMFSGWYIGICSAARA
jgi:hypothetical protein